MKGESLNEVALESVFILLSGEGFGTQIDFAFTLKGASAFSGKNVRDTNRNLLLEYD